MKTLKNREHLQFLPFLGSFWGLWGVPKNPKISTNTQGIITILRQLNCMGETFQLGYKFGAWKILLKNRLIKYFFSI